jgi:hypothetical protein
LQPFTCILQLSQHPLVLTVYCKSLLKQVPVPVNKFLVPSTRTERGSLDWTGLDRKADLYCRVSYCCMWVLANTHMWISYLIVSPAESGTSYFFLLVRYYVWLRHKKTRTKYRAVRGSLKRRVLTGKQSCIHVVSYCCFWPPPTCTVKNISFYKVPITKRIWLRHKKTETKCKGTNSPGGRKSASLQTPSLSAAAGTYIGEGGGGGEGAVGAAGCTSTVDPPPTPFSTRRKSSEE